MGADRCKEGWVRSSRLGPMGIAVCSGPGMRGPRTGIAADALGGDQDRAARCAGCLELSKCSRTAAEVIGNQPIPSVSSGLGHAWMRALVQRHRKCKTSTHRFESGRRLHFPDQIGWPPVCGTRVPESPVVTGRSSAIGGPPHYSRVALRCRAGRLGEPLSAARIPTSPDRPARTVP